MPNYFTFTAPSTGLDISSYNVGQDPPYVESFQTSAPNVFVPDRRPIVARGFANQTTRAEYPTGTDNLIPATTTDWVGMIWGNPTARYRRTPAVTEPDSAFDVYTTAAGSSGNGKLGNPLTTPLYVAYGFERYHYWNIAGFTNTTGGGHLQDYFASIPYSGLFLDSADYITTRDTTVGAINSLTPYTPTGVPGADRGDNKRAWIAAFSGVKTQVSAAGGTPEIGVYGGYRPMYTGANMNANSRVHVGMDPNWTGTGTSPAYAPDVGSDYVDVNNPGVTNSTEKFRDFWAPEVIGLKSMGVDLIGLDTGGKMWLNSAGMTTGGSTGNESDQPTRLGDGRLNSVFDNLGIQQYGESTPMWSYGSECRTLGNPPTGTVSNQGAYENCPYLTFFNSIVGYQGKDEFGVTLSEGNSGGFWIYNETSTDGGATIGKVTSSSFSNGSYTFDKTKTEVHIIIQWGETILYDRYLNRGWLTLKQVLYDAYTAGLIIGVGGSSDDPMTDGQGYSVSALEFHTYVINLNKGLITARPAARDYTDYMTADAGVGYWDVPAGSPNVTGGITGGDTSTNFSALSWDASSGVGTTQSGITTVSAGSEFTRGIIGGYGQLTNPYQYVAIGWREAGTAVYGQSHAAGWVVLEVEQTPGGIVGNRQSYIPIEGTDGMGSGATFIPAQAPFWNALGTANDYDMTVFFFDGYQAGDVGTWTVWDGVKNPTTYEDWDTYHSGFIEYSPLWNNNPANDPARVLQSDTTWQNSTNGNAAAGLVYFRYFNNTQSAPWYPPAVAQWWPNANGGAGEWRVGVYVSDDNNGAVTTVNYGLTASPNTPVYTIYLDTVPVTLPSTWRAYDGPVPADFSSPNFYPVQTTGVAGVSGQFAVNQYDNTQLFNDIGMVQINTEVNTDAITFFFQTVKARDEFKAFTDFTFGGTSFNPSADTDWEELNLGSLIGYGLKYIDSVVCAAWTTSMTPVNNASSNVTGSHTGTSTWDTILQSATWTLTGATWTGNAGVSSVGLNIVDPTKASELQTGGGPRIWQGTECGVWTGNGLKVPTQFSGGSAYSPIKQTEWFHQSYDWRVSNNNRTSGAETIMGYPGYASIPSAGYNNLGASGHTSRVRSGPTLESWATGDVVNIEVRDNSNTSKRLVSFIAPASSHQYATSVNLTGAAIWNGNGGNWVYSRTGSVILWWGNTGLNDGWKQWLIDSGNSAELWNRDTDTVVSCTVGDYDAANGNGMLIFTDPAILLTAGERYEIRIV